MFASRLRIPTILIVCAIALLPARARAGDPVIENLAWLPADVDLVLAVRDMTRVRATPMGSGATELVKTVLAIGGAGESKLFQAWESLAEKLGYTNEQAFDALLGERFICVVRDRDQGEPDWVVFSKTSTKIARRVREKLDVAPREIKHDRVLMSLEGGAFRLGSLIENDASWLILAPTDRDGLFTQITGAEGEPTWATLGATIAFQEMRSLRDGQLALYMTLGPADCEGWLALNARPQGQSVVFEMISDPGKPLPAVEPWPSTMFDELRDGCLLAHIERLPSDKDIEAIDGAAGRNDSMLAILRSMIEIPRRMLGDDLKLILGHRLAIAVHPREDAQGIELGMGLEASDVKALATPGDAAMRSIVVDSLRNLYQAREAGFNFIGSLPRAPRQIVLAPEQQGGIMPPFGSTLPITWSFRDSIGKAPEGWWVAGTNEQAFDRCARSLTGDFEFDADAVTLPWLMQLEAHPASLIAALREGGLPIPDSPNGIEAVDTLRVGTWIDQERDLVSGEGSIRFIELPDQRKGPRLIRRVP